MLSAKKEEVPTGASFFFVKKARDSKVRNRKRSGGAFSARRADVGCF